MSPSALQLSSLIQSGAYSAKEGTEAPAVSGKVLEFGMKIEGAKKAAKGATGDSLVEVGEGARVGGYGEEAKPMTSVEKCKECPAVCPPGMSCDK